MDETEQEVAGMVAQQRPGNGAGETTEEGA
jgi:hypothetical protein